MLIFFFHIAILVISLLNVDYKIASARLANRMKHILDKLISEKQTVFLKGRSIGENTRFIYDLIERANANNIPGLLVLLDFEKAFNSLEWNFIVTVNTSEFFWIWSIIYSLVHYIIHGYIIHSLK